MNRAPVLLVALLLGGCAAATAVRPGAPPAPVEPRAWTMEGGGPERSSEARFDVPRSWQVARIVRLVDDPGYAPEEWATPLVFGGVAYVGHGGRSFDAVRLKDGRFLWRRPAGGRIYTTPARAGDLLIFGDDEGFVRALDLDGNEAWRFDARYPVVSSPVVAGDRVFIAVADQNVFCLEAATGRPLWQYGRRFPKHNFLWRGLGLCYGDGRVYAGFSDGTLVALDPEVGRVLWRLELGPGELFDDVAAGPVFRDGRLYAGVFGGALLCLEAATGREVWRAPVEVATGVAVGERTLFVCTTAGGVAAVVRDEGAVRWSVALDGGSPSTPVVTPGGVVVGASEGSLHLLDPETGEVRERYAPGPGFHSQPLVFDGGILALSDGGALHWIR